MALVPRWQVLNRGEGEGEEEEEEEEGGGITKLSYCTRYATAPRCRERRSAGKKSGDEKT